MIFKLWSNLDKFNYQLYLHSHCRHPDNGHLGGRDMLANTTQYNYTHKNQSAFVFKYILFT